MNETAGQDKCVNFHARIDGYHLATMRADRKKQITISLKLFEGKPDDHRYAGLIMFMRKDLPDDYVDEMEGSKVIFMHALVTDFDRMMDLVAGDYPVAIEFMGESEKEGRAYLKSLGKPFPGRKPIEVQIRGE